nr:MFS transporter [Tessaracoccus coleopterorum]
METLRRERFLPALRAGGRFVRHEAGVPALLIRLLLYTVPGSALWVALPLIAERQLGMNSTQYGALMSLAGLGRCSEH